MKPSFSAVDVTTRQVVDSVGGNYRFGRARIFEGGAKRLLAVLSTTSGTGAGQPTLLLLDAADPSNLTVVSSTPAPSRTSLTSRSRRRATGSTSRPSRRWNPVREASFDTEFFVRQHYADFLNREPTLRGSPSGWVRSRSAARTRSAARSSASTSARPSSPPSSSRRRATSKSRAFVLMQYFGYLRRNPDDAPEAGLNYAGWRFWLSKLEEFGGDFVRAEMVKAFLSSDEYPKRFGQ